MAALLYYQCPGCDTQAEYLEGHPQPAQCLSCEHKPARMAGVRARLAASREGRTWRGACPRCGANCTIVNRGSRRQRGLFCACTRLN